MSKNPCLTKTASERRRTLAEGHRERLKKRFLAEDLERFEPHNALEILLFYALPRIDTNMIAHRLIDRFGSFSGVLDAPCEEIASVDGVGENAAIFLKLISATVKYYEKEQNINKALVSDSSDEIGRLLVEKLSAEPNEKVVLMMLDNSGNVTDIRVVYEGSVNSANVNLRRITEAVLVSKASSVILAHNHPGGIALPSVEDIEVTQTLKKALLLIDVDLVEHYIIAPDGYAKIINS